MDKMYNGKFLKDIRMRDMVILPFLLSKLLLNDFIFIIVKVKSCENAICDICLTFYLFIIGKFRFEIFLGYVQRKVSYFVCAHLLVF